MENQNTAALIREVVSTMTELRVKQEAIFDSFAAKVAKVDRAAVFGDLEIPADLSFKGMCPEYYAEVPNIDVYNKQWEDACVILTAMNEKIEAYWRGAAECQSQLKQLLSKTN